MSGPILSSVKFIKLQSVDDIVISLLILGFFWSAITQAYLYSDDHMLFSTSLTGSLDPVDNYYLRDGRPVTGLLLSSFTNKFNDYSGFTSLRAAAAVFTILLSVSLRRSLRRAGVGRILSLTTAIAIVTAPCFAIYIGWVSCFLYPLSALTAFSAGNFAVDPFRGSKSPLLTLLEYGSAILLLVFSLSVYQITATFFLLPIFLHFASRSDFPAPRDSPLWMQESVQTLFRITFIAMLSNATYFLLVLWLRSRFLSESMTFGQRGFMNFPDSDKILSLLEAYVFRVLPGWLHFLGLPVQLLVTSIVFSAAGVGLMRQLKRTRRAEGLMNPLIALFVLSGSIISLAFIDQSTTPWRLFSGSNAMILCALAVPISRLAQWRPCHWMQSGFVAFFTIFLTANILYGHIMFRGLLTVPNISETNTAVQLMHSIEPHSCDLLVAGSEKRTIAEGKGSYEYSGNESGIAGPFPRHAIRSLYGHTVGRSNFKKTMMFVALDKLPPDAKHIKTKTLYMGTEDRRQREIERELEFIKICNKDFGAVYQLNSNVFYSLEYGYLLKTFSGWYYNPGLGDIWPIDEAAKGQISDDNDNGAKTLRRGESFSWVWSDRQRGWVSIKIFECDKTPEGVAQGT